MADIFLSYAREDWQRVKPLAEGLAAQGWSVWWDTRMRAGRRFDEMIEQEIAAAPCVIVVWTEVSVKSRWVRAEAAEALEHDKLIPVFLDAVKPPLEFRHVQGLELQAWKGSAGEQGFIRLIEDASHLAGLAESGRDASLPEPEMVRIEPGRFLMGSVADEGGEKDERPQHRVRIARPFAIGKYAVTFDEYGAFARAIGQQLPGDEGWGRGRRPVINVSWEDAVVYAQWLSQQTGRRYRLPTEAEWECAARAGTTTPFWTGACIDTDRANYSGTYRWRTCRKTGVDREQTVEVGSFAANPWGLHDVHGNVWEWVQDCWHDSYKDSPDDGSAWESEDCEMRVVRGGSWNLRPRYVRSAIRGGEAPDWRDDGIGFRVALDLP